MLMEKFDFRSPAAVPLDCPSAGAANQAGADDIQPQPQGPKERFCQPCRCGGNDDDAVACGLMPFECG